ncbi:hypothetical protein NL676_026298 [Syzygium grande]|nr:hypothetical protein NL676_026298 [Syzygium grande]
MGDSILLRSLPLRVVLLLCTLVALFSLVTADVGPGCATICGNLTFSYPFRDEHRQRLLFQRKIRFFPHLLCDNSTDPLTPFMSGKSSNFQILNISIENHEISVTTSVAEDSYNSSNRTSHKNNPWVTLAMFPISPAKNKFMAVGCDTYTTFTGRQGSTYAMGYLSSCDSISDVINGSCAGIGCCETSIPLNYYRYNISVS